nr:NADH dehydrogenase subunit 1 [Xylophagaidae sp. E23]UPX88981.1 NADH dehydrogenase subunit 1 [Xylophagaidae sp. E81]
MVIGSAFLVVTERKALGMLQLRQGPNKASLKGFAQPVADGVKLLSKGASFTYFSQFLKSVAGPFVVFLLACLFWLIVPVSFSARSFELGFLFFLCVSSLSVYGIFLCGWSCNSRYGLLGSLRGVAQTISYEALMSSLLFCPLLLMGSFDFSVFREWGISNFFLFFEVFVLWIFVVLAETNRAPFDFVEGESEIVSGYSVEFGGGSFAMIALGEYSNIFFMSVLTSLFFFWGSSFFWSDLVMSFFSVLMCYFVISVRGAFPRLRYDLLMEICWKTLLPLSFSFLTFFSLFC